MMAGQGFDWAALMQAGLSELRLTPDQFWRLTPVELAMMLGRRMGAAPMSRSRLDALMTEYPDQRRPRTPHQSTQPGSGNPEGERDERA